MTQGRQVQATGSHPTNFENRLTLSSERDQIPAWSERRREAEDRGFKSLGVGFETKERSMLKNGRRILTIHVRPEVAAAIQRMAAMARKPVQALCEDSLERLAAVEIGREIKRRGEADNVSPRPHWMKPEKP